MHFFGGDWCQVIVILCDTFDHNNHNTQFLSNIFRNCFLIGYCLVSIRSIKGKPSKSRICLFPKTSDFRKIRTDRRKPSVINCLFSL